ncbi:MAG: metal-dependent transcriptional regulator [Candidatus Firestonebacteria bacterium]
MLNEQSEEMLETLWITTIENKKKKMPSEDLCSKPGNEDLKSLELKGLVKFKNNVVQLTREGEAEARDVVRRHRLAERLLVDVLNIQDASVHDSACAFEHVLHKGIDESICTMLGHPKTCPHGTPIPPGKCCVAKGKSKEVRVVAGLNELRLGEKGKIAYIQASSQGNLNKMMAMGVLPGNPITLIQSFPSYLFKVGNSQFAVDGSIAKEIFVRIERE